MIDCKRCFYSFSFNIGKIITFKKKTQINVLTTKLMCVGLSALYKALGAGDRKAATSHISESLSTVSRPMTQEQQRQGGGFLSKMNPFSK